MKYLLTILLFACSLSAGAQVYQEDTTKYMKNPNAYPSQLRGFWALSILRIPDTTNNRPQQGVPGAIGRNTDGTELFTWDGEEWIRGGGGIEVDSVFISSIDSIFITNTDSIFIVSGTDTIFIGEADNIRDTAHLDNAYGIIITDGGQYAPNGVDNSIAVDTSIIATKDEINIIINNDTTQADFIVDTLSNSPPVGAPDGYKVLIGTSPTGAFAGHANDIAELVGGVWNFTDPEASDQAIVDNAITYQTYQFNGTTWVPTNKLVRWNGDRALGRNAWIGRSDKQPLWFRSWNKTGLWIDTTRDVYMPKMIGIPSNNFAKWDPATGKFTYDVFQTPVYETPANMDSIAWIDDGVWKYGTASGGGGGTTDKQDFTLSAAQVDVTITGLPSDENDFDIFYNYCYLPPSFYSVSGTTLTLTSGAVAGDHLSYARKK